MKISGFSQNKYDTGEVTLNYYEGPDNGTPIILLAGQALSVESYKYVLRPLSEFLKVYGVDIRGHGESGWTPGKYNFPNICSDIHKFIKEVIKKPAFISGNSSGGLVALCMAAYYPDDVLGIILEDAPVFSSEWPRLKETWVYTLFEWNTKTIGSSEGRNLAEFFKKIEVPMEGEEKVIAFPQWIGSILGIMIKMHQKLFPGKPVDLPLMPPMVRLLAKSLSIYDPDFTRAFVEGRGTENFNHSEALSMTKCPILLLRANWFENKKNGLVGAMNNEDVKRALILAPQIQYKRIISGHMIHFEKPKEYLRYIEEFTRKSNV